MQSITRNILLSNYKSKSEIIFQKSSLIQYIDKKITSVGSSPKSRPNITTLYAIYVLIKDYKIVSSQESYEKYQGAKFITLLKSARNLPFGSKIQNHVFNHRCNMEYKGIFKTETNVIMRENQKYKINQELLLIDNQDISDSILTIIEKYIETKTEILHKILKKLDVLKENKNQGEITKFFQNMLSFKSDARLFEITSFVILKNYFSDEKILIGKNIDDLDTQSYVITPEKLKQLKQNVQKFFQYSKSEISTERIKERLSEFHLDRISLAKDYLEKITKAP